MISRYGVLCKVVELGSFTKTAEQLGYSQSAVSQTIKTLEQEVGTILLDRKRDGIVLTADGMQFFPYLQSVYFAEEALSQKQREMKGLENTSIHIGTFTSVSRTILPLLMKRFKAQHPDIRFVLRQGDYTSIGRWVQEGSVDFGFVNTAAVSGIALEVLYQDEMMAVLPPTHPLANQKCITLQELAQEPFILLDEGEYSLPISAFQQQHLTPRIEYEVYDDYSILAMVRQGLGVSAIYRRVLEGFENGLALRPIAERLERTVALAWQNWDTMSYAARHFIAFILEHREMPQNTEKNRIDTVGNGKRLDITSGRKYNNEV